MVSMQIIIIPDVEILGVVSLFITQHCVFKCFRQSKRHIIFFKYGMFNV